MVELLIGPITSLLDKFIPDKDAREKMAHEIATLAERQMHEQMQMQMEINKQEAAHKSLFVAGWRPFIGWVCGLSMAFNYMIMPLFAPVIIQYTAISKLEPLDLATMLPVLLGMLGLGSMRSAEKVKRVAREK